MHERAALAGVAVDAVFDSVSVATTFKDKLAAEGVIFCSFSEAVKEHSELVKKYLGTVVPQSDNYFAGLNSAVFTDGSFVYIPKGVRCPMELSTYFRINASNTGQFERTLIIADEGSYVSYLEGCTAPMRDENSFTQQWWSSLPSKVLKSSTQPSRIGTLVTKMDSAEFTTSLPNAESAGVTILKSLGLRLKLDLRSLGSIRAASSRVTTRLVNSIQWR